MKKESNNSRSVVTSNIESKKVEAVTNKENNSDKLTLKYNEYRDELSHAYKKTRMDNSVVSTFSINDDKCKHVLVIKKDDKERIIKKHTFKYNDDFIKQFLIPMIEDYKKENFIHNSKVELLGENQSNLVIRTKLNDSLIILGSKVELANKLERIISGKKEEPLNEEGIGSFIAIGLLMISMIMLIVGIVILISM